MSWVSKNGLGGFFLLVVFYVVSGAAAGSSVLMSASTAEFPVRPPIWVGEIAPHLKAAVDRRWAITVSRILPKQDCSEIGRYALGLL